MSHGNEHRWGEPDKDGVRACTRVGCFFRIGNARDGSSRWRSVLGGRWHPERREPLPPCSGTQDESQKPATGWRGQVAMRLDAKPPLYLSALHIAEEAARRAEVEIERLKADNAALVTVARDWLNIMEVDRECSCVGADVCPWHRLRTLLALAHPGAALLEEHRKALVRARNEGLEKAVQYLIRVFDQPTFAGEIERLKAAES